jgi:hypothetical protein
VEGFVLVSRLVLALGCHALTVLNTNARSAWITGTGLAGTLTRVAKAKERKVRRVKANGEVSSMATNAIHNIAELTVQHHQCWMEMM